MLATICTSVSRQAEPIVQKELEGMQTDKRRGISSSGGTGKVGFPLIPIS
tara:strand:+ start:514 stop:663 length:150 start_codon:yes stop_codon:yes gene_type:complete